MEKKARLGVSGRFALLCPACRFPPLLSARGSRWLHQFWLHRLQHRRTEGLRGLTLLFHDIHIWSGFWLYGRLFLLLCVAQGVAGAGRFAPTSPITIGSTEEEQADSQKEATEPSGSESHAETIVSASCKASKNSGEMRPQRVLPQTRREQNLGAEAGNRGGTSRRVGEWND